MKRADQISRRRIVPDGVVGPHADPVGDGAVLALLLGQLLLDPEGLVRRLHETRSNGTKSEEIHGGNEERGIEDAGRERFVCERTKMRTILAAGRKTAAAARGNPWIGGGEWRP
jgi:hypothetical protein